MDEVHDNGFAPPADEPPSEIRRRLNVLNRASNGFNGCLQRRLAVGQQVCCGEEVEVSRLAVPDMIPGQGGAPR